MGEGRRKEGRKGGKQRKTINRERHLERERQKILHKQLKDL